MIKSIERTQDGLDSLIDKTHDTVVRATDRAESGVESAAKRIVEGSHLAGDSVREGAKATSRGAHLRLGHAAQAVDRGYLKARSELSRATTATANLIVEHPGKSILAAAAAGFLAGMLVHKRLR